MQTIKRILSPVDFSDKAGKIIQAAAYMAGTFKAELHLVFVAQTFEDYSGFFVPPINLPHLEEELFASAQQQMETYLEENKAQLAEAGVSQVTGKVLSGDIAEEILHYAVKKQVQLIVMGTHGYKGVERIMFGSVAEKVVKSAGCPVMTVNPYRE
ncbi:MAG: universal stress protein [Proteobacteria bacterium]|nr:universal stress protein [Pseudomonadota bacterium]